VLYGSQDLLHCGVCGVDCVVFGIGVEDILWGECVGVYFGVCGGLVGESEDVAVYEDEFLGGVILVYDHDNGVYVVGGWDYYEKD